MTRGALPGAWVECADRLSRTTCTGHGGVDLFEEPQHVRAGVALVQSGQNLTGGDVHRGEQVDRAVAFVVMGHRAGAAPGSGRPILISRRWWP